MKCLCIGICQLDAMYKILKNIPLFTSIYTEIYNYTIFTLSVDEMNNILNNIVPTCDLVLSQPVSSNYQNTDIYSTAKLRSKIKPGAKHFIVSNCYFTGYDPIPFQITDETGQTIHLKDISYIPSLSLPSLLLGNTDQACKDWCNIDGYTNEELNKNYLVSITELKKREQKVFDNDFGIDITISDYIEKNYKTMYLFHTYNHPTNILLFELVRRLLNKLKIMEIGIGFGITTELLGIHSIPPSPAVYIKNNMTFKYPKFIINSQCYTTKQAMSIYSDILKVSNSDLHNKWLATIKYGRTKINS